MLMMGREGAMAVEQAHVNEAEEQTDQTVEEQTVALQERLFTIEEFERVVETGIFGEDERVELIEGRIVLMNPIGDDHIGGVNRLNRIFMRGADVNVSVQNPVRLGGRLLPQPDLAVLRPEAPLNRKPVPADILLLIEVADTSLAYDRQVKANLYARANIPEYWIVDINGERVEAHSDPTEDGYQTTRRYRRGQQIAPAFKSDLLIDVDEILGPVGDAE
jgi:Uma2 family endonuclease